MSLEDKREPISRKSALKKLNTAGKAVAAAGLGLSFLGFNPQKALAQFEELEIGRALNFILMFEFLQEAFYVRTTTQNGLLPQPYLDIFREIKEQHQARVVLVKNVLATVEIEPVPQLSFNFRAHDEINPLQSFENFLALAQIIEDTAAGVYKEQTENILQENPGPKLIQTLMRLHSTESRHAYFVRQTRAEREMVSIKGWINQPDLGELSSVFENIYAGEGQTVHEGIDVPSITDAPLQAVQEAWDEPIGRGPAGAVLQLFTRPL